MRGGESRVGATIVPSPLGGCAVAFGEEGLLGVFLPGEDDVRTLDALRAAVRARRPDVPPALPTSLPEGRNAEDLETLSRHLQRGDADLTSIRLDYRGLSPHRRAVSEAARAIPRGEVRSYGDLARAVGSVARAIGRVMATNPFPVVVPCHRVVAANGAPGGFSAPGGLRTKKALLDLEGFDLGAASPPESESLQVTLWQAGQK